MNFEYYDRPIRSYFYYSKPLKDTTYLRSLNQEKTLLSRGLDGEEYFSPYECASEFLIYPIHTNYKTNNFDAIRIVDIYEKAANDGIIEVANNLGIIYHYLGRYDLCENYFRMASQGGSYLGTLNLELFYYDEQRYDEFKTTNLQSCSYNNPISLYNYAVANHFGLEQTPDLDKAITIYTKILSLKESDIKINVTPSEEDRSTFYSIQKRAANNLAILYTEHKIDNETIMNYPLVKWQVEFMKHVNHITSIEPIYEPTFGLEFSVLMSRCFIQNNFSYLNEMLEDDAILIIQNHKNILGKEAIINYFRDWLEREHQQKADIIYTLKHFDRYNTWTLQFESSNYATANLVSVFHYNKIRRITLFRTIWQDINTLYQTRLNTRASDSNVQVYGILDYQPPFPYALPCPICGRLSSALEWHRTTCNVDENSLEFMCDVSDNTHLTGDEEFMSVCPTCKREVELIRCIRFDNRKMFL